MEESYIKKILRGDISLYSYFINRYKDMGYTIAFRITGNKEDAEEVLQDSFLKAYNALPKFRLGAGFATWFYRIVVNTALTKVKRQLSSVVQVNLDEPGVEEAVDLETAFTSLHRSDQRKIIQEVLAEMELEDRLLLTLYYLNENTIPEIAEIILMPPENIKMKLHRARKKMYRILNSKFKTELQYLL